MSAYGHILISSIYSSALYTPLYFSRQLEIHRPNNVDLGKEPQGFDQHDGDWTSVDLSASIFHPPAAQEETDARSLTIPLLSSILISLYRDEVVTGAATQLSFFSFIVFVTNTISAHS